MKKVILIIPILFVGCSISSTPKKVKEFTQCYVHKIAAPFWVCYETPFMSVGKVHTQKVTRLSQEEAYAVGMKSLSAKILIRTKEFLKRLNIKDDSILKKVKSFIIMNALTDGYWYDKKTKILYEKVVIDKNEFKNFLFSLLKGYDKKVLEVAYEESF
jgi:hypothetical protein